MKLFAVEATNQLNLSFPGSKLNEIAVQYPRALNDIPLYIIGLRSFTHDNDGIVLYAADTGHGLIAIEFFGERASRYTVMLHVGLRCLTSPALQTIRSVVFAEFIPSFGYYLEHHPTWDLCLFNNDRDAAPITRTIRLWGDNGTTSNFGYEESWNKRRTAVCIPSHKETPIYISSLAKRGVVRKERTQEAVFTPKDEILLK
jgi:hypothetical protein